MWKIVVQVKTPECVLFGKVSGMNVRRVPHSCARADMPAYSSCATCAALHPGSQVTEISTYIVSHRFSAPKGAIVQQLHHVSTCHCQHAMLP